MGGFPVWRVRLYSIHHKILAFFALLILGVLLLGGIALTLSHRMHTSTVAVRSETQDLRWIDELRVAGKSVRKYTLRHYSFFFKEIEAKSAEFSTPS